MKLLSASFSLIFAVGFFQTMAAAERIDCVSNCAACWKIGSTTGEDIKMPCNLIWGCPFTCPSGYDRIHCAKESRCECPEGDCGDLGPCACGIGTKGGGKSGGIWKYCKGPDDSGKCPT